MTSQREGFEKWAAAEGYMLEKREDNRNSYEFDSTRYAWEGYRAAQADQAEYITMLESALNEITLLRSSTINYGVARCIANKALGRTE